ncbi:hypothetical protein TWF730_002389 [Orbilia blumenaviensis]|uniref:Elongin-A n=1 Tax=Orbilia blumenaviensis TaxID=1796055 RepID=A0AAV9UAJ1_9PEZI
MLVAENEPFPSLFELAKRVCIRNVGLIDDVGELPYYLIRPILLRLENPDRLRAIETKSPHIVPETAELWRAHISRSFGDAKLHEYREKGIEGEQWREVYYKLLKKQKEKDKADIEKLKADIKKLSDKKEKRTVGRTTVRRQDISQLRNLDRGFGGNFGGGGGGGGWGAPRGPFSNSTLNKVLTKGRRR